jgi:hypothetical protein
MSWCWDGFVASIGMLDEYAQRLHESGPWPRRQELGPKPTHSGSITRVREIRLGRASERCCPESGALLLGHSPAAGEDLTYGPMPVAQSGVVGS